MRLRCLFILQEYLIYCTVRLHKIEIYTFKVDTILHMERGKSIGGFWGGVLHILLLGRDHCQSIPCGSHCRPCLCSMKSRLVLRFFFMPCVMPQSCLLSERRAASISVNIASMSLSSKNLSLNDCTCYSNNTLTSCRTTKVRTSNQYLHLFESFSSLH